MFRNNFKNSNLYAFKTTTTVATTATTGEATTTFFLSPVFNWSMVDWQNNDLDPEKKLDKNFSFGREPKIFQSKKKQTNIDEKSITVKLRYPLQTI